MRKHNMPKKKRTQRKRPGVKRFYAAEVTELHLETFDKKDFITVSCRVKHLSGYRTIGSGWFSIHLPASAAKQFVLGQPVNITMRFGAKK